MKKAIRKLTTERFHSVNGVDSPELALVEREVTTYNEKGIPVRTDYEQFEFDDSSNCHGRISEFSHEDSADGGRIEKSHLNIGEEGGSTEREYKYKYDPKGREIEKISFTNGKVDYRIITECDDINETEYFCRYTHYDKDCDIPRLYAERVVIDGGTKTVTGFDYDADMNLIPFNKEVIVTCIDEDGKQQYLHEDLWMKGEHIWEYIYEYAGGDFNACTTIEKRKSCVQLVVSS